MMLPLLTDQRVCILTSTKGLQDQLAYDFGSIGLVDIRGQNNYSCKVPLEGPDGKNHWVKANEGMCRAGGKCDYKRDGGCDYYDLLYESKQSNIVSTNYAYWMTMNKFGGGLTSKMGRPFDLLVLDEAHDAPEELSGFMSIAFERYEVEGAIGGNIPDSLNFAAWKTWAEINHALLDERCNDVSTIVQSGKHSYRDIKAMCSMRRLQQKLRVLTSSDTEWVIERVGSKVRFDPVWPGEYAEKYLFCGVPKVLMVSATVRPKTAALLNIPEDKAEFVEYPSTFAVSRRPVIHVPTVRMNYRTDDGGKRLWLARIDQIISKRQDRKGIIHTVSYDRRNLIVQNSKYRDILVTHGAREARSAVNQFKRMEPPAVLVSPSVGTGWDFPYEDCQYIIIGKIPFPDTRSKVLQARTKKDKEYTSYLAAMGLVQACGRGMRAEDDWCEVLVIDDNIRWFKKRCKDYLPKWFLDSNEESTVIPAPPPK
jgi:Rad3-related DNA helicase